MARLAIFIDGGYITALARDVFSVRVDFERLVDKITETIASRMGERVVLFRAYYYDCLPY